MNDCKCVVERDGEITFCPLHSAAKDLLKACQNALESLMAWNSIGLSGPAQDAMRKAYENSPEIKMLVSAIAKATGGTK